MIQTLPLEYAINACRDKLYYSDFILLKKDGDCNLNNLYILVMFLFSQYLLYMDF